MMTSSLLLSCLLLVSTTKTIHLSNREAELKTWQIQEICDGFLTLVEFDCIKLIKHDKNYDHFCIAKLQKRST